MLYHVCIAFLKSLFKRHRPSRSRSTCRSGISASRSTCRCRRASREAAEAHAYPWRKLVLHAYVLSCVPQTCWYKLHRRFFWNSILRCETKCDYWLKDHGQIFGFCKHAVRLLTMRVVPASTSSICLNVGMTVSTWVTVMLAVGICM